MLFLLRSQTGISVMQQRTTARKARPNKQENSLTLHCKLRARELPRKRAKRIVESPRSQFVTKTLHALKFMIWVEVHFWCSTKGYDFFFLSRLTKTMHASL